MNPFFLILGLVVGYIWQDSLKKEKFVIDVNHPNKILLGLSASLADKYKSNVWVVRLFNLVILNFAGYIIMYLFLPKTQNQGPSVSKTSQSVSFKEKNKEKVKIEIE